MSTSTRPAWSDDCFKPAPERHYKGKRPSRRPVAGNSARTTSVASIVTQEGVHADEAADWLGLGRRRNPEKPPPPGTRSLREALEASAAPTQHAAGQTTARKSMRELAERYQPRGTEISCPRVYGKIGHYPKSASISDDTIQMDHNAVVLFTIDRLARSPRTTVRTRGTELAPDRWFVQK